jgi:putative ATPase
MKNLGYGKGYQYDPDTETGFSGADYFPDGLPRGDMPYDATTHAEDVLEIFSSIDRP